MTASPKLKNSLIITQPVPADCSESKWQKLFAFWLSNYSTKPGSVIVSFVNSSTMKQLHQTHLGTSQLTDVLTFPYQSVGHLGMPIGEIVICLPVAKRDAKRNWISIEQELTTLFVHGLLHLAGKDHYKSAERARFQQDTHAMMESVKLTPVDLWSV